MAMPCSCSPPSPELFTDDELAAAEALLSLHSPVGFFPRWLKKRKRSVPAEDEDEVPAKGARLSPRIPLSFDPSSGDNTLPPPPPPPILPPPPAPPLPPRPKRKAPDNNSDNERCKRLAKEREQSIAALSTTKLNFEQSVAAAKSRCQFLKEENALQFQWRLAWIHQQQQRREMSSSRALDLFSVGLHHHHQHTWLMPCLNWKPLVAATAALQQQKAAEYAQARKRRLELRRTKTRPSSSRNVRRLR